MTNSPGQGADGEHVSAGRRVRPGAEERGGLGAGGAEGDVGRGAGEELPPGDQQGPALQPRHRLGGVGGGAAKALGRCGDDRHCEESELVAAAAAPRGLIARWTGREREARGEQPRHRHVGSVELPPSRVTGWIS